MANSKFLYSKKTKLPDFPFQVVVKDHGERRVLYVTYGGGKKTGGGSWSESLNNVHPRTMNMIRERLGEEIVLELEKLQKPIEVITKGKMNNENRRSSS